MPMFWSAAELTLLTGTATADKLAHGAGADVSGCVADLPCQVRAYYIGCFCLLTLSDNRLKS